MTWVQVGSGVGVFYGLFTAIWLSARIGARYTIVLGMFAFALGSLECGSAVGLGSLILGRFIDGFGKMMVMGLGRTTLYKQFDRMLLVAVGFYGVVAYATRNSTPLLMAELDVGLSWRWMYWFYVPIALLGMASATFLTTWFHRRRLRHVWLVIGVVGIAVCEWWLSSLDNFTPKGHLALMLACWAAFLGLIPPAFLTDEIEGLNPKDFLYAGALAVVGLVVPILTIPTPTGTVIKAWSDGALDTYCLFLSTDRPAVSEAWPRGAD